MTTNIINNRMETNTQLRAQGYNKDTKEVMPFSDEFNKLSVENKDVVRTVIMHRLKIARSYFNLMKNGRRPITKKQMTVVKTTLQSFGIIWEPATNQPAVIEN